MICNLVMKDSAKAVSLPSTSRRVFLFEQTANLLALALAQAMFFHEVDEQRREGAARQFVGEKLHLLTGKLVAFDGSFDGVRERAAVSPDVAFRFQAFEELLHGRRVGDVA